MSSVVVAKTHTATLLYNNKVLAAGGYDSFSNSYLASAELYTVPE